MSEFRPREITRIAAPTLLTAGLLLGACNVSEGSETPTTTEFPTTETTLLEPGSIIIDEQPSEYPAQYTTVSRSALGVPSFEWIDLLDYYQVVENQQQSQKYVPLITINLRDDKLIADDVSPLGMDEKTVSWFGERVTAHAPLLRAALQSESMDSIIIALSSDQFDKTERPRETGYIFGYFNPDDKSTVFEISTHATTLSAKTIDQYLVHESIHALFASNQLSYFSDKIADPALVEKFQAACMNLRSLAAQDISYAMSSAAQHLRPTVENQVDPAMTARYQALYDIMLTGAWGEVQPTISVLDATEKIPACRNPRLGQMAAGLASKLNLPATNPDLKNPTDSPSYDGYDNVQAMYDDLMKEQSLYRVFSESTYLYKAPAMGHPHDSLDELVASTMNGLISFPEDFAMKVKHLSDPAEQQAVIEIVRLTIDQITETNPDLHGYFSDIEARFLTAFIDQ